MFLSALIYYNNKYFKLIFSINFYLLKEKFDTLS